VRVTRGQLTEGVADPNDGPAVKLIVGYTLPLHPASIHKTVSVLTTEPLLTAQLRR